ncbi:MAG: hypothetical protein EOP04_02390 [Proteobacteria bacterium]|nr:MAG: hypothetical protein EOP04_02390 [Pseudomonadota bacterium]
MKKLALLSLISIPAFAHQVPFSDPTFLKLAGGNPEAAFELSYYCGRNGISDADCVKDFSQGGIMKQEATQKCMQSIRATTITYKFKDGGEIPGARATTVSGSKMSHAELLPDEEGILHLHQMSERDRIAGSNAAEKQQTDLEIASVIAAKGSSSRTTGGSVGGGGEFGTSSTPVHVVVNVNSSGSSSTTINSPLLDQAAKDRIESAKKYGHDHPEAFGIEPSILCRSIEKNCREGMGWGKKNPYYDPKAKAPEAKSDNKDNKGADNPPKHRDDTSHNLPEVEHISIGKWAGNDTRRGPDDPMIATPVLDDESKLSPMEKCVEKETKRLIDSIGKTTIDPNFLEKESVEDSASSLLKYGYCDEQVYGKAGCLVKRFTQNSVVAVEIQEERKEAARQALEYFNVSGLCDPNALGRKFCDAQKFKWETTPTGSKEINFEISGRRPFKTGDIPREWE